jgi:hypothetical protein
MDKPKIDTPMNVEIVELPPMSMVTSYGFGKEPENIASLKIHDIAESLNLKIGQDGVTTYGFNHPDPSPGSPNYGYELWLPLPQEINPVCGFRIVNFSGGLYAVTQFKGLLNIGYVWGQLAKWREKSRYHHGHHQWLEELLTPFQSPPEDYIFNLYLPITE